MERYGSHFSTTAARTSVGAPAEHHEDSRAPVWSEKNLVLHIWYTARSVAPARWSGS
ncbi:hypothetical protein ACFC25_08980 [Pseudarthrobacter sp. NPDC055928]|uniref:hypothetical protein n=1 Tax=Pseudarthrobacter sp. NPDC055928 TaxID=3345661 RepID=UPI0035E158B4